MKIAFIGQKGMPARGGGVERYVNDLSSRLVKLGHEPIVYTRPYYTDKTLTEYKGVSLVSLKSFKTKHLDAISHTFLACLDAAKRGVDIVHFQAIGPALLIWLIKLLNPQVKVIATLQSRDYEHQKWGLVARTMLKLGEKLMVKFADELVVVTQGMADYVKYRYGRETHLIHNGANLYEPTGSESIKRFGLSANNYIVAISRLVRHKGLHYLIQAYNQLGRVDKPLVIVGESAFTDDYVAELHKLAAANPNIIFTGQQTGQTLAELYSNAYLFVQPSESEGLSLALLEAMSRRTAVLASDISENKEAILTSGFLFTNKDVADLREKLRFLLAEPELIKERAQMGRLRIESTFNWANLAKQMLDVYELALANQTQEEGEEIDSEVSA